MSFRRSKAVAATKRAWDDFREANATLFQASGVPSSLSATQDLFDDLLMHGYVDHHEDPTRFSVDELSAAQKETLVEIIVRYLRTGFADPGIGGFMGGPTRDEILRRSGADVVK